MWYHANAGLGERLHGRWLGVAHRIGSLMSYWILTQTGSFIARTTVQRVTSLEYQVDENKDIFREFDLDIKKRLNEQDLPLEGDKPSPSDWAELMDHDEYFAEEFGKIINNEDILEADATFTPEVFDNTYLNMELALPQDEPGPEFAHVTKSLRNHNRLPIGTANHNPILDSQMYEVEYQDGHKASLSANAIAQNMFAKVDEEGNIHIIFQEIVDHRVLCGLSLL